MLLGFEGHGLRIRMAVIVVFEEYPANGQGLNSDLAYLLR